MKKHLSEFLKQRSNFKVELFLAEIRNVYYHNALQNITNGNVIIYF